MTVVFQTKLVSDRFYPRNGQKVKIVEYIDDRFVKVRFPDGTVTTVYRSELKTV